MRAAVVGDALQRIELELDLTFKLLHTSQHVGMVADVDASRGGLQIADVGQVLLVQLSGRVGAPMRVSGEMLRKDPYGPSHRGVVSLVGRPCRVASRGVRARPARVAGSVWVRVFPRFSLTRR